VCTWVTDNAIENNDYFTGLNSEYWTTMIKYKSLDDYLDGKFKIIILYTHLTIVYCMHT